jgi:hypothetical protein
MSKNANDMLRHCQTSKSYDFQELHDRPTLEHAYEKHSRYQQTHSKESARKIRAELHRN